MDLLSLISHPDIARLSQRYPQLKPFITPSYKIDFSNSDVNYILSTILAKEYFNLDIHLDKDHLCPRIPNRLDYILWINALLEEVNGDDIIGLDVGTGASCIYPLLSCSVFPSWTFYATDINKNSISSAKENVERNSNMIDRIKIIQKDANDSLFESLPVLPTFTMCNPPFYENIQELTELRNFKARAPSTLDLPANDSELFTPGGESSFTMKLLRESLILRDQIKWYTTMVGKKQTLIDLVIKLQENAITNYAIHEIKHGHTKRWTIAWSFTQHHPRKNISRIDTSSSIKQYNPMITELTIPYTNNPTNINHQIESILDSLISAHFTITRTTTPTNYLIAFQIPTWTRSYRRAISQNKPITPSPEPTIIQLELHPTLINLWWKYGSDYKLFESFYTMIKSHLS